MGIDGMRVGGGRCPPLLVVALLLVCLMLFCNWWALSSENVELVRQIDELNEQLKISAEERDQCVTLRGNLEQRYKHIEDELASVHVRMEQQIDFKKKNDELEDSVTVCKSELDSLNKLDATKTATLETLRLEKDTITTQLDVKRNENKKLQEEVEKLKGEVDQLKLSCNAPLDKKDLPVLHPIQAGAKQINDTAEQDLPVPDDIEDPENRAHDNNADEVQSTDEAMPLPDNYEEEAKAQDATGKPEDKNT
ncbi:uncharacterized protein LOC116845106 isoform X2 [Odontomachus brunneus]|uniref:uncharacterized protein LOC116845106 isoform X2 n=1 Tax=Odontomachus brunneus TaxID=486640 RepID=UPI0013F1F9C6|nr:uncharacterized protein LOC116845106 isoform X2 [Odontomachus brunneus]